MIDNIIIDDIDIDIDVDSINDANIVYELLCYEDDDYMEYTEWFWEMYGNDVYDDYDSIVLDCYGIQV